MTEAQKQKLLLPFPASDIEWRTAYTNAEKTQGFAVPFVNSRAIRLLRRYIFRRAKGG